MTQLEPQSAPATTRSPGAVVVALVAAAAVLAVVVLGFVLWRGLATDDADSDDDASSPGGALTPGARADGAIVEGATSVLLAPTDGDVDPASVAGIAALLDQRLAGTGAVVTLEADGVYVMFPSAPGSDVIAHLTDPVVTELRPVLAITEPDAQPADVGAGAGTAGPAAEPTSPSDADYYLTGQTLAALAGLDCAAGDAVPFASPEGALVTCDATGSTAYALGPVEVTGDMIAEVAIDPQALASGAALNEVVVTMTLDARGTTALAAATSRLATLAPPANQLAIVVDGRVASAPNVAEAITGGQVWLSGGEDRATFAGLVAQLLFGRPGSSWQVASSST